MVLKSVKTILRKIKNTVTMEDPAAKALALEVGLLKGHTEYTRFIILGRSRTGSNFLRGLIDSHPAVMSLGEVFRNREEIDFDNPDYLSSEAVLALYQSDPVGFLETVIFRIVPQQISALGFKLFYYHARTPPFDAIWPVLEADTNLHVIHIKRDNILRTHLSRENAQKSGRWVNTSGDSEEQTSYMLDFDECLRDFNQTREWEQTADQFFKHHPLLEVIYERLAEDPVSETARIQKFLGLEPHPLQARTYKQIQKPLTQSIQNYYELKARFTGTEWAKFFED
jgi:LPS sulfotransferase NodH